MGSISRHIMPLVINSPGADTHTYTSVHGQSNSKKPGAPGLKIDTSEILYSTINY